MLRENSFLNSTTNFPRSVRRLINDESRPNRLEVALHLYR
jgi:hypothetical protein